MFVVGFKDKRNTLSLICGIVLLFRVNNSGNIYNLFLQLASENMKYFVKL